ncbi:MULTISPECIES: HelD family protein [unclassified Microbacterium]|uniref:HelD family protein n=1 Tax=unclassified Microbacterium TaxID=2609290 RepID=UPI003018D20D
MTEATANGVFHLPDRLRAKGVPALVADDERHFARVSAALAATRNDLDRRLADARRLQTRSGQEALERDLEIQRLSARRGVLSRFGDDVCIGRTVALDGTVTHIGRLGLADDEGRRLLVDWRAPAAEPFFAAGHGHPMGLTSRRRYRWVRGCIVDYWDEVFAEDGIDRSAALDDQSAFIASLGASRSPKMRDVLATIQTDQDAVIRSGSRGALVVDGGPGTGKTVVALHRAAYLLYADPRLQPGRGGLLFVGPHRPYIDYIDEVLPSLGEEGAVVATLAELVTGGPDVAEEPDPHLRRIAGDARMPDAVEAAVRLWERPPATRTTVPTAWGPVAVSAWEWSEVFTAAAEGLPHNAVRTDARDRLLDLIAERIDAALRRGGEPGAQGGAWGENWGEGWGEASVSARSPEHHVDAYAAEEDFDAYGLVDDDAEAPTRAALEDDEDLSAYLEGLWPLLDPDALLRGLFASPRMLRVCAPWLAGDEAARLAAHAGATEWTDVDLPLLDVARRRVGDPRAELRRLRRRAEEASERRVRADVVTHLVAADDGDLRIMSMLRGQDLRRTLAAHDEEDVDPLAGPFAHIVVDEAQELTDAQWRMLLRRCPARSFTIVGDRAQARHGFEESWDERLRRIGMDDVRIAALSINYRTPQEVMDVAGPVIREALPDANVPTAIRRSGVSVHRGRVAELEGILAGWLHRHDAGTAVVVGAPEFRPAPADHGRVRSLSPRLVKGLEFDLVVLVDPSAFGEGVTGAVDRYVAMTRATGELVVLEP